MASLTSCHHISAVVPVIWYLMLRPQLSGNPLTFNADAPLSKWDFAGVYDTAQECESSRGTFNQRWLSELSRRETRDRSRKITEVKQYQARERCVAATDPRLEGKGPRFNVPYRILPSRPELRIRKPAEKDGTPNRSSPD
jgi:hypothetical protein